MLEENPAAVWFDASIRFNCPHFMQQITPYLRTAGIVMVLPTIHSNFEVTRMSVIGARTNI